MIHYLGPRAIVLPPKRRRRPTILLLVPVLVIIGLAVGWWFEHKKCNELRVGNERLQRALEKAYQASPR